MDYYIGGIVLFPYGYAPYGWALCDGTVYTVNQYQALYSLLGQRFGGNGSTTFAVPNLMGAEPIPNMNYYICMQGLYPSRG